MNFVVLFVGILAEASHQATTRSAEETLVETPASNASTPSSNTVLRGNGTISRGHASHLITADGYAEETHEVRTEDGHILNMHRIPNRGPPVYLQHGLLSSSTDWVVLGRNRSLAFLLHDVGFDVWIGNFRGNTYSRGHVKYSVKDKEFWDFTWHELGIHDVPAMIDYILLTTKHPKVIYIGHSMGTTTFFVTASMKPEYNDKVSAFFALAPIAYLTHMRSVTLRMIALSANMTNFVMNVLGMYEFLPADTLLHELSERLCSEVTVLQWACSNMLFLLAGFNEEQVDREKIPDIVQNVPAGTSSKLLVHFAQMYNSDQFRQFDHGILRNLIKYRHFKPQRYPLYKVSVPVHIHWAANDILATTESVERLKGDLPNVKSIRQVPHESFNHLDFMYGKDARQLLYEDILEHVKELGRNPKADA